MYQLNIPSGILYGENRIKDMSFPPVRNAQAVYFGLRDVKGFSDIPVKCIIKKAADNEKRRRA